MKLVARNDESDGKTERMMPESPAGIGVSRNFGSRIGGVARHFHVWVAGMALACVVMAGCNTVDDLVEDGGVVDLAVRVDQGIPAPPDAEDPARVTPWFAAGGVVWAASGTDPTPWFSLTASFSSKRRLEEPWEFQIGPCILYVPVSRSSDGGYLDPRMGGNVHLVVAGEEYSFDESDGGITPGLRGNHTLWQGGDLMTFSGSGGEIPDWTATLIAPTEVEWLAPAVDPGHGISLSATNDNLLKWTPGYGYIEIGFFDGDSYGPDKILGECSFPANTGTAVLPAAAVAAMGHRGLGWALVSSRAARLVHAGSWPIAVFASTTISFAFIR